ncbi:MAG: hypothetical protein ACJA0N_001892 [Pseudohongiellaceae bacterium]|jgi:hypothetical protein
MSEIRFNAEEVSYQQEDDNHVLAFYNDDDYVFLQRHVEVGSKEDDGVYIEYKTALHCGFDVIEAVVFSAQTIEIVLKSCLYQLPDVKRFVVSYSLDDNAFAAYSNELRAIFAKSLVDVNIVS